MEENQTVKNWTEEIKTLKAELREREQRLPAHSILPHQLLAVEELEEKINGLQEKIKQDK